MSGAMISSQARTSLLASMGPSMLRGTEGTCAWLAFAKENRRLISSLIRDLLCRALASGATLSSCHASRKRARVPEAVVSRVPAAPGGARIAPVSCVPDFIVVVVCRRERVRISGAIAYGAAASRRRLARLCAGVGGQAQRAQGGTTLREPERELDWAFNIFTLSSKSHSGHSLDRWSSDPGDAPRA